MTPSFEIIGNTYGTTGNCYSVAMGRVTLHFSYKTLIGVHVWWLKSDHPGTSRDAAYRQKNVWGPTTGRHMKVCGLDGPSAKVCTEEELYEIVRGALFADVVAAPLNQGDSDE
jgi:hypothetical protein